MPSRPRRARSLSLKPTTGSLSKQQRVWRQAQEGRFFLWETQPTSPLLPRHPMPVDRELVLFCTLALEAHLLVGLPQVLPFPLPPRP